jgi:hypothetical protein
MNLLRRVQRLEEWSAQPSSAAGDDDDDLTKYVAAMTEEELDHLLTNLLLAGPRPADDDPLAAVWERVISQGVDVLSEAELDAMHQWIVAN